MMIRALFFSAILHLAVLLSFRPLALLPEMTGRMESRPIAAQLVARPFRPESAAADVPAPSALKSAGALPLTSRGQARLNPARVLGVRIGVEEILLDSTSASGSTARGGEPAAESVRDNVDPDAIRQYRLNLAREARQFKHYPPLARARGWEGAVVVVVTTVADSAMPQVSLSQSSGFALLDDEALLLVSQAVRSAALPDGLRKRNFALTLPIHYRLDE